MATGRFVLQNDLGSKTPSSNFTMRDAMQAAICVDVDLPLVTRNTRHSERFEDLEVVHPDEWAVRTAGS